MKKLTKLFVGWNEIVPAFESRIKQWKAGTFSRELDYRDDLYIQLRAIIPEDCVIQKEYRHLGTTVDIWIKWQGILGTSDIGFELKLNLTKKTEFDRLIGQIEQMEPKKTNIIVILVGNTDETYISKLRHRYSAFISNGLSKTMAVIHIPVEG